MKKSAFFVIVLALFVVLSLAFTSAAFASKDEAISTAYKCLINSTNKSSLSLEEAIFTQLALGFHNLSNYTIGQQKSTSENCWPSSGCTLERTAQVGIVYDYLFRNTTGIQNWLYTKNGTANGINWFLEIDIENQKSTTCSIRDNTGVEGSVSVSQDQLLSGTPGSCFSFARDGYFLGINQNCLDRTFEIKCNENFLTAVLYKKTNSETYYVSGETHSSVAEGTTSEKVTSKCFKNNNGQCDYKGTLWASLALQFFGRDVSEFIPYLIALSDEDTNFQYFPSAFLYMLTESDDSYNDLTQSQQQGKFWRASVNNSRIYDTALGTMALQGTSAQEFSKAQDYFLEIQESNGCWNNKNIRDTAFILYAGWAQPGINSGEGGSRTPPIILGNNSGLGGRTQCELGGFTCATAFGCLDAGGVLNGELACTGAMKCCSVKAEEKLSCSAQNGIVCSSNQRCEGRTSSSSSGTCCLGSCIALPVGSDAGNLCESNSYGLCKASCGSDEYDSGFSCSSPGYLCCSSSSSSSNDEEGSILWIVFLLGILIILAILGIIYKDKVKIWWFKLMSKFSKGKPSSPSAVLPRPTGIVPRRLPALGGFSSRPLMRPAAKAPTKPQPSKNKEYEETLRKLREMSK